MLRFGLDLFSSRVSNQHIARHSFLQQKLGRLDNRLGVKAGAHRAVLQSVRRSRSRSSPDGAPYRSGRSPPSRLRGAAPACSPAPHTSHTGRGRPPRQAARSFAPRRAGSTIAASAVAYGATTASSLEPALEPQARDAEARILISELQIPRVVRGFRYAPREASSAPYSSAAERRSGWSARAGSRPARASPGTASGTRTSIRTTRPAPNRSPPASRYARAETSGESARRPWRSRRNSPGAPRRRASRNSWNRGCLGNPIPDRKQLARRVEEKTELHRVEHFPAIVADAGQTTLERFGSARGTCERREHRVDSVERVAVTRWAWPRAPFDDASGCRSPARNDRAESPGSGPSRNKAPSASSPRIVADSAEQRVGAAS